MSSDVQGKVPKSRGSGASQRYYPPDVRWMQITNAAAVVFAEKGFSAARMSDIAEQAGVSQGTIYRFFESKEDIALGLFKVGQDACRAELARLIDEIPAGQPLRVVREYVHWYARYLARRREIVIALFSWELDPVGRHGADIGERPWIAERLSELLDAAGVTDAPKGTDFGRLLPLILYGFTALGYLYRAPDTDSEATLEDTVSDIAFRILDIDPEG
ncbi:MAG TPA: TetR/AcrR family transcriptional regulator [Trebonia sp.]|jgi:AcrR family transcriptional regulator|nr:TetR/AcrR family transcriptional regulator [Trebonia sp.]